MGILATFLQNYFEFEQVVKEETSFKIISIICSGGHFVQQSGKVCAILVEGIMKNSFVKLVYIWTGS